MRIGPEEPAKCKPNIPRYVQELIDRSEVAVENKIDGSRYLLYLGVDPYNPYGPNKNVLLSRRISAKTRKYVDKTDNVPHITGVQYTGLEGTVIDGEIFFPSASASGAGMKDFLSVVSIMNSTPEESIRKQAETAALGYAIFDVLWYKNKCVKYLPYGKRRAILEDIAENLRVRCPDIQLVEVWYEDAWTCYNRVVSSGGEGVVVKLLDSEYGKGWYKIKKRPTFSTVIIGFVEGKGKYKGMVGAVRLGVYNDGEIVEIGRVSGMSDDVRVDLTDFPDKYLGVVLDVTAQELTPGHPFCRLRHPSWYALRPDVSPESVTYSKLVEDAKCLKVTKD